MWFGLKNKPTAYEDVATVFALIPSLEYGPMVTEPLNTDLAKISVWCKLQSMKLSPKTITATRSRTQNTPPRSFPCQYFFNYMQLIIF